MPTVEELQKELEALKAVVQRQQVMIAKTGQLVIEQRLGQQRQDIKDLDTQNKMVRSSAGLDKPEFITQEDVVELVQELQGQLDMLEDRNIRRIVNSRATGKDTIVSLPSTGNEFPEKFPTTAAAFEVLDAADLERLCQFYELLPPSEEEIQEMLRTANMSKEQAGLPETQKLTTTDHFNYLAEFLGLAARRSDAAQ